MVPAMIDALTTAAAGLKTNANLFEKAAQNVVKATAPQTAETDGRDDLPAAIVAEKSSEIGFSACADVFKTADKMLGGLIDTVA